MAGGLAQAQASSAAFATMGSQAEVALNSGWAFDQRDNAGSFLTNASPTSSGGTFISTGDATGFYIIGRAVKVIQAAGTVIGTVGQSSFSGGITSVYLNQFSTAANLSTALSTGAITSAAGSPIYPLSTANNTFGGPYVISSTGGNPNVSFGVSASTLDIMGFPNNAGITARNAANTLNAYLLYLDNSDRASVGDAAVVWLSRTGSAVQIGVTPASSGVLRLPQSAIGIVGRTSTGGNDVIYPMQFQSTTLGADIQSSGVNFTTIFSKTLGVGTWHVTAGMMVGDTGAAAYALARITDGVNDYANAEVLLGFGGTTAKASAMVLSAIVSHSTALAYQLQLGGASTTPKAKAISPNSTAAGSTGAVATWWTAIKIGSSGV